MALTLTQVPVTNAATPLIAVPPGGTVTLVASATTSIGMNNLVTTTTGFSLPANVAVTWTLLDELNQASITLYAITGTTSTVSVALSN